MSHPTFPISHLVFLFFQLSLQLKELLDPTGDEVAPPTEDERLHTSLLVGGIAPGAELELHRQLNMEVARKKAQVVVATPSTLLRIFRVGAGNPGASGEMLLLRFAESLDALVLDELDALLPRPKLAGADFYSKVDWARAERGDRSKARKRAGVGYSLLKQLQRALKLVRGDGRHDGGRRGAKGGTQGGAQGGAQGGTQGGAQGGAKGGSRRDAPVRSPAGSPPRGAGRQHREVQVVGVSATLGKSVARMLQAVLNLREPLRVVSATHTAAEESRKQLGRSGRDAGGASGARRGLGSIVMPPTLRHLRIEAPESLKPQAVAKALEALRPRNALIVLPINGPVSKWLDELRASGFPQLMTLHDAMGFPTRSEGPTGRRARTLHESLAALRKSAEQSTPQDPLVLLTTEASVRGFDLPFLDAVVLLYAPLTADRYVHLAGRVGRGGSLARSGTVVSVLDKDEIGYMGLFSRQLRLSIKDFGEVQQQLQGAESERGL